jgi:tetratricopeptide (TPR) repeat protein
MPTDLRDQPASAAELDIGQQIVAAVDRCCRLCGEEGLRLHVARRWSTPDLLDLLDSEESDVVRAALICLGGTAGNGVSMRLAQLLRHQDRSVVDAAERALWSIWFRAGWPVSRQRIRRAVLLMREDRFAEALAELDRIVAEDAEYAEAFHQRAIARYLMDDPMRSIADCRRTLALNPVHFGALVGMGHCLAHLGQLCKALDCYRAALDIHPRLDGVRQAIRSIRTLHSGRCVRSVF